VADDIGGIFKGFPSGWPFFSPQRKDKRKMPTSDEYFSTVKELLPLITAGTAIISAVGLVPRFGPGLAVWLALRSRFAAKPVPESIRSAEIKLLKRILAGKKHGQGYLVIAGEKGVGKTCLLNTVTGRMPGVIHVDAAPGHSKDDIVANTQNALTRPPFKMRPMTSTSQVLFWYRLVTRGESPIVVISATEREPGQGYAGLTGAVRTLVEKLKLRVVVDGSPNSISQSVLQTTREEVIEIKPMDREMIWRLDQLQDLFKCVKEAGLDDVVYAVLGGIPSRYENLGRQLDARFEAGQDPREFIGTYLCAQISDAIKIVKDSKTKTNDMDEIIKLFDKDKNCILAHTLTDNKLERPTPDKVFREVKRDGVFVLIPASNAIGIVLRHGVAKEPSLDELEELVKHKM